MGPREIERDRVPGHPWRRRPRSRMAPTGPQRQHRKGGVGESGSVFTLATDLRAGRALSASSAPSGSSDNPWAAPGTRSRPGAEAAGPPAAREARAPERATAGASRRTPQSGTGSAARKGGSPGPAATHDGSARRRGSGTEATAPEARTSGPSMIRERAPATVREAAGEATAVKPTAVKPTASTRRDGCRLRGVGRTRDARRRTHDAGRRTHDAGRRTHDGGRGIARRNRCC